MNKFQVIPFELRSLRSFTDSFPINVPKSTRHGLNPFFIQPWCHWNRFTEFYRVFVLWLSARHTRSIRYGGDEQNGNSSPSNWGHYLKGHWGLTSGREPNWKRNMWRSRKKVEERGVESEEEEQQHRKKYQTKLPFFSIPFCPPPLEFRCTIFGVFFYLLEEKLGQRYLLRVISSSHLRPLTHFNPSAYANRWTIECAVKLNKKKRKKESGGRRWCVSAYFRHFFVCCAVLVCCRNKIRNPQFPTVCYSFFFWISIPDLKQTPFPRVESTERIDEIPKKKNSFFQMFFPVESRCCRPNGKSKIPRRRRRRRRKKKERSCRVVPARCVD